MNIALSKKVLVVDDEVYLADIWREIFRLIDTEVVTAASGDEAISVLKEDPVDLVITDLRMRGSDGFVLLDYIKEQFQRDIPVVVCSGFFNEDCDELSSHKITRFIPKPFSVSEELAYLQGLLAD